MMSSYKICKAIFPTGKSIFTSIVRLVDPFISKSQELESFYNSKPKKIPKNGELPINKLLPQRTVYLYFLFCCCIMYICLVMYCNFDKKLLQIETTIARRKNESKNYYKQMRKFYSKSTGDNR